MDPKPNNTCPLCGGPNGCAPAINGTFEVRCWCTDVKVDPAALARIPEAQRNQACICRQCATAGAQQK
ncbi:MAG TPA: cysteine-rich CWC family protein [Noviherbaspirillum sp.]|nr:cysteine-rich CWC family protein [Noviherbaspirillum sp.]